MPVSIKDVVNAASGAAILPGQIVQFKEGQVPDGFAQTSGISKFPTTGGAFLAVNLSATAGIGGTLFSVGGKLLCVYTNTNNGLSITELSSSLAKTGYDGPLPTSYYSELPNLLELDDGGLLRIGGRQGLSTSTTTVVNRYNPATGATTSMLARPTAIGSGMLYAQAGDRKVYGFGSTTVAGTSVECFDYPNNTWNTAWGTRPSFIPLCTAKLPSGRLYVVAATAQYAFDPSKATPAEQWVQVSSLTVSNPGIIATATGVRIYSQVVNAQGVTVSGFIDVTESNWSTVTTFAKAYFNGRAVKAPYGPVLLRGTSDSYQVEHYLDYTPSTVVDAVKL